MWMHPSLTGLESTYEFQSRTYTFCTISRDTNPCPSCQVRLHTQSQCSALEKKVYRIMAIIERRHWLLSRSKAFDPSTDHDNLVFTFNPFSLVPGLSQASMWKVICKAVRLSIYNNECIHLSGVHIVWADLLSRRTTIASIHCIVRVPPCYFPRKNISNGLGLRFWRLSMINIPNTWMFRSNMGRFTLLLFKYGYQTRPVTFKWDFFSSLIQVPPDAVVKQLPSQRWQVGSTGINLKLTQNHLFQAAYFASELSAVGKYNDYLGRPILVRSQMICFNLSI